MTTKLTNANKIYPMVVKYSKWPECITTFSIPRPSKMYPNRDSWFEKKPSGNPDAYLDKLCSEHSGPKILLLNRHHLRLDIQVSDIQNVDKNTNCRLFQIDWIYSTDPAW
jgi:hypothetical protein